jgi:hypothetical protein
MHMATHPLKGKQIKTKCPPIQSGVLKNPDTEALMASFKKLLGKGLSATPVVFTMSGADAGGKK